MTKNSDDMAFETWAKENFFESSIPQDKEIYDCEFDGYFKAEMAWQAAIAYRDSTTNPFTGCKCKLYESERSKMLEAKRDKAVADLAHERKRSEKLYESVSMLLEILGKEESNEPYEMKFARQALKDYKENL